MNFYLGDRDIDFELDSTDLKFYPNNRKIEFIIPVVQEGRWILTTGIWDDGEYWDDYAYWKDSPN